MPPRRVDAPCRIKEGCGLAHRQAAPTGGWLDAPGCGDGRVIQGTYSARIAGLSGVITLEAHAGPRRIRVRHQFEILGQFKSPPERRSTWTKEASAVDTIGD